MSPGVSGMQRKILKSGSCLALVLFLGFSFVLSKESQEEKILSEYWMGIYVEGVKVGYSHTQEISFFRQGEEYTRILSEAWTKASRLGGIPVEIRAAQESVYRKQEIPVTTQLRTQMSDSEMIIKAEIFEDKIEFWSGEKLIKEIPYSGKFYLGIPVKKIIEEGGLIPNRTFTYPILDPMSYAIKDSTFEVIEKEDVLILGKKMRLWHVRTELMSLIPVLMDEWIDEEGNVWKSITKASFITETSIRMPKEMALVISEENWDIAFSTIIKSNVVIEAPQRVKDITFKLGGITGEQVKKIPFDDGSQRLLKTEDDSFVLQSVAQIFQEGDAISFPVADGKFRKHLVTTPFCQSDDPEIKAIAKEIVGEEQNAWRAAKAIVQWVSRKMKPNYDVGFATAKEILTNREGDCSEYTVITVALCRAVGIPARAAVGIKYAGGIFALHMWPEVYVGRWINLDPNWLAVDGKTGELYTDAVRIKFGRSNLDENIYEEMVRAIAEIIGKLKLEIVEFYQDE
jgi:transglutaminase-like putative cysteine protease